MRRGSKELGERYFVTCGSHMSRIGKQPIDIPSGVQVKVDNSQVLVEGPKGSLSQGILGGIGVEVKESSVIVTRESEARNHRALHGLTRTLISNMVVGVSEGFQKTLDIVGVGYRAQQSGEDVIVNVGYSHPVEVHPLEGITLEVEGNNRIHVKGIDKQLVGETAARIKKIRKPNVYTGKGIRYLDEQVKLKPGKRAARAR
mgnify:FL=1